MIQESILVLFGCFASLTFSLRFHPHDLNTARSSCYDYIIVGGGISGLVVANRLTEDPDITVLVLEAGDLDNYEDTILYPIENGKGLGSKYDWNLWTAPQTHLDGAPRPYDMGRGVGGGSLINGMCWTRGGRADFDAWVALGNPGWGWDDLLPYFKKSENYTNNVDAEHSRNLNIKPDPSTYGTEGYIHISYPRYFYNQSQLFLEGLQELGIPILTDPNNGTTVGGMIIPVSLSPDNQTRSSARLGYFDGFFDARPNFHIATGQHVTRLIMKSPSSALPRDNPAGLWVNGVEFISDGSKAIGNVTCRREVILAAGTVHTPQILELSGIGHADILNKFDIPVVLALPGTGNNFQDHGYVGVVYYYNNASYFNINKMYYDPNLYSELARQYYVNKTGPWTSGAINTVAFPSLRSISNNWTNMVADAAHQDTARYLLPNLDPTILAGYEAQKRILVEFLRSDDVSAYEILNNNVGLMSVAAMHTFSRGSIHIQSTNPFIQPLIDPRYCSNPLDCQILVEGLLFNNRLINTTALRVLDPAPYYPFFQDATPETLMPAINSGLRTEFHGTGATSMMPLEMGGVVDTHLRVYGTKNLRIVDAGIMPLVPASHLQASVYAVAEKAADIIKADNADITLLGCAAESTLPVPSPVLSNLTKNIPVLSSVSFSSPLPTASTFAQLLNLSAWGMLKFTRKPFTSASISRFSLAAGAIPAKQATSDKGNGILIAASIFFEPSGSQSSPSGIVEGGLNSVDPGIDRDIVLLSTRSNQDPSSTNTPSMTTTSPLLRASHAPRNAAGIMHQLNGLSTSMIASKTTKMSASTLPAWMNSYIGVVATLPMEARIHKILPMEATSTSIIQNW